MIHLNNMDTIYQIGNFILLGYGAFLLIICPLLVVSAIISILWTKNK